MLCAIGRLQSRRGSDSSRLCSFQPVAHVESAMTKSVPLPFLPTADNLVGVSGALCGAFPLEGAARVAFPLPKSGREPY